MERIFTTQRQLQLVAFAFIFWQTIALVTAGQWINNPLKPGHTVRAPEGSIQVGYGNDEVAWLESYYIVDNQKTKDEDGIFVYNKDAIKYHLRHYYYQPQNGWQYGQLPGDNLTDVIASAKTSNRFFVRARSGFINDVYWDSNLGQWLWGTMDYAGSEATGDIETTTKYVYYVGRGDKNIFRMYYDHGQHQWVREHVYAHHQSIGNIEVGEFGEHVYFLSGNEIHEIDLREGILNLTIGQVTHTNGEVRGEFAVSPDQRRIFFLNRQAEAHYHIKSVIRYEVAKKNWVRDPMVEFEAGKHKYIDLKTATDIPEGKLFFTNKRQGASAGYNMEVRNIYFDGENWQNHALGNSSNVNHISPFGSKVYYSEFGQSLNHQGQIKNFYFVCPECQVGCDVTWADQVNTTANANDLTKTSGTTWWNAGAASTNLIPAYTDGWAQHIVNETTSYRMFGLSYLNDGAGWDKIDFNCYSRPNGQIQIYQRNIKKHTSATNFYKSGDVLRVERKGYRVLFKKNNKVFFELDCPEDRSLIADVSMYSSGSTIGNAVMSHCAEQKCDVVWTNLYDVAANGNNVEKTSNSNNWNSGASSINVLRENESGWVESVVQEEDKYRMFGLSYVENASSPSWSNLDFKWYIMKNRELRVYVGSTNVFSDPMNYATGDVLRVERSGNRMLFIKNGEIRYETTCDSQRRMAADASIYSLNATIKYAVASFCTDWQNLKVEKTFENDKEIKKSILSAFPNPFTSELTISKDGLLMKGEAIVYDVEGREVETIELNSLVEFQIGNEYDPGVYYISILSESGSETVMFIKQ